MAGLAARERRAVATVDFPGANLNAAMKGTETAKLNSHLSVLWQINSEYQNYLCDDGTLLLKLKKALYDCMESARLWCKTLREQLKPLGFTMDPYDACVFNRNEKDDTQTSLVVHVDDMFASAGSESYIDAPITELDGQFDAVSCERDKVLNYLEMICDFNIDGKVKASTNKFIDDLLEEYKDITGTAKTPAGKESMLSLQSESLAHHLAPDNCCATRRDMSFSKLPSALYFTFRNMRISTSFFRSWSDSCFQLTASNMLFFSN